MWMHSELMKTGILVAVYILKYCYRSETKSLLTLGLLMSYIYIYGRSPAEIVGSTPTRSMDICLL
jgi:hypothetical protein